LERQFKVTLLLFDIDNFKKYNDDFGHCVGDEILKQTAIVMRGCCREHDVVARISGDEFAVVFWDKEGPRQPREPRDANTPAPPQRPPHDAAQVFERFRRKIASPELRVLGDTGQGTLTISGGLAVCPWDARTPEELIQLADKRLMFGAKKAGKDSLFLVGGDNPTAIPQTP
jgi:GGDEF domain-containing protein